MTYLGRSNDFLLVDVDGEPGGCFYSTVTLEILDYSQDMKFNIAPEKLPGPERKVVFQPSFFRGYVKLQECIQIGISLGAYGKNLHEWLTPLPVTHHSQGFCVRR